MKFRLAALIVLFSLILAACSLAEDITPPPGYQSPTVAPTLPQVTETPAPARPAEAATSTPGSIPAATQSLNPTGAGTTTPATEIANITGLMVNGSGGKLPAGLKVTLEGFDKDSSGSYQNKMSLPSPVNPDGSYSFKGVPAPLDRVFLVITSSGGVEYQSDPVAVTATTRDFAVPITIYDKSDDSSILSFNQVHLIFGLPTQNTVQVTELFVISNTSKQVVVVPSDGAKIPFIQIPANTTGLQYQLSQGSARLLNATGGFAILPGADKQYAFIATYNMVYTNRLKFVQPFSLPVASLTVFAPQGMRVSGGHLTDAGLQTIQNQSFQMYQAGKMAAGSSLSLTLSGKPGTSSGFKLDRRTWILIGIGAVGLLLVGLGLFLFLRDRARLRQENESIEPVNQPDMEKDALGDDRDGIMDAIVALDDQFKAGEIPREAYETRRQELKERLKGIL
jgi:hypothetical protein